ncbi:hypothetical protein ACFXAZ_10730 [Streptomyces sp. NPDC059477]|uniref:hypothetical protein n=1 Tax=Streptomyces sp. NPDC059477 TaxID=3346847 RepID=UPI00369C1FCF
MREDIVHLAGDACALLGDGDLGQGEALRLGRHGPPLELGDIGTPGTDVLAEHPVPGQQEPHRERGEPDAAGARTPPEPPWSRCHAGIHSTTQQAVQTTVAAATRRSPRTVSVARTAARATAPRPGSCPHTSPRYCAQNATVTSAATSAGRRRRHNSGSTRAR